MNKKVLLIILLAAYSGLSQEASEMIDRQGSINFFSYTSVENIKAKNNQVFSNINAVTGEIAVSILMRAFVFEKALMEEHFNESYIESDLYPRAKFEGEILDFNPSMTGRETKKIRGVFTLHGREKEIEFKAAVEKKKNKYIISGDLELTVKDYDIKIRPILSPNIAETITADFNFEYVPYEN